MEHAAGQGRSRTGSFTEPSHAVSAAGTPQPRRLRPHWQTATRPGAGTWKTSCSCVAAAPDASWPSPPPTRWSSSCGCGSGRTKPPRQRERRRLHDRRQRLRRWRQGLERLRGRRPRGRRRPLAPPGLLRCSLRGTQRLTPLQQHQGVSGSRQRIQTSLCRQGVKPAPLRTSGSCRTPRPVQPGGSIRAMGSPRTTAAQHRTLLQRGGAQ